MYPSQHSEPASRQDGINLLRSHMSEFMQSWVDFNCNYMVRGETSSWDVYMDTMTAIGGMCPGCLLRATTSAMSPSPATATRTRTPTPAVSSPSILLSDCQTCTNTPSQIR